MRRIFLTACLLASLATVGAAATVWDVQVGDANLTGSRTTPDIVITAGLVANPSPSISWSIVPIINTANYTYSYTFTGFASPAISHFILELSTNCTTINSTADPCFVESEARTIEGIKEWGVESGNPGFPVGSSIWGVKFDFGGESPLVYSFTSNRIPVWGNFYIKGGSDEWAYNAGLAIVDVNGDFTSEKISDFIARPDSEKLPPNETVPEPSTYALIGGSLIGLAALRNRKR